MWSQTYHLDPDGKVVIDQTVGRVYVTTWDEPHVQVSATGDEPSRNLKVRAKPRKLVIETDPPDTGIFALKVPRVDLEVHVPPGRSVVVDTGAGEVIIDRLDARNLKVDSGIGSVTCSLSRIYPGGRYEIDTGTGETKVEVPRNAGLEITLDHGLGRITSAVALVEDRGVMNGGGASLILDLGLGTLDLTLGPDQPAEGAPPRAPQPSPGEPPPSATPPGAGSPEHGPGVASTEQAPEASHRDEVHRVLRMVEEGKLSPEDADEILKALEEERE